VSKRYGNAAEMTAVDDFSLVVAPGEICVFVGPSGCGKTTTLKMVNRLVEPSSGQILIDGVDVSTIEVTALRRRIGYVIQQIGLFPHRTVGQNVATVPELLGWPSDRIRRRVDELLEMVGLDPDRVRGRYPAQLSGGERQRVGVARAMAGEPPVMLMDEPFGAVDPIVRERLQDEFLRIHHELRTTVLFVTHDVDEAIKMGDHLAVMQVGGILAQFGRPSDVLTHPASDFVERFLGSDRALKRLALSTVRDLPAAPVPSVRRGESVEVIAPRATLDGPAWVVVVDSDGRPVGRVSTSDLPPTGVLDDQHIDAALSTLDGDLTLRDALSALLTAGQQVGAVTGPGGVYAGVITIGDIEAVFRNGRDAGEERLQAYAEPAGSQPR
jgi:osmoprotectant transport system ATP-binding protein